MALTGPPKAGSFYPRIIGGGFTIDFADPAEVLVLSEIPVGIENLSTNGTRERIHERFEDRALLRLRYVDTATMKTLRDWWRTHAGLGKQSVVTLDQQSIPAAPIAAIGAAGNVNAGLHSWRVTFVLPGGETAQGTVSGQLNLTVASQVNLSSLPLGPAGTTARKVYRTVVGDTGAYKLVGTVSDNTTTTFTDNVADASLGANAPTTPNTGQLEYDLYNTYFSRAEFLTNPFQPTRSIFGRPLYLMELLFRQGP